MTLEALGASVVALSILVFSVSGYHQFPTSVQFTQTKQFNINTYVLTHMYIHAHTHTKMYTQTHPHTHRQTQTQTDRHTESNRHTNTQIQIQTHAEHWTNMGYWLYF